MRKLFLSLLLLLAYHLVSAQETFPVNGVKNIKPGLYALVNARIVSEAGNTYENATLIVRGQTIENIGNNITPPQGAVVIDLKGKTIYPSFIDAFSSYGLPATKRGESPDAPKFVSAKKGAYAWNEAIRPETNARDLFQADRSKAEELRKLGFGVVLSVNKDGIARGNSVLVSLTDKRENEAILKENVTTNYSFGKGTSTQDYPSSLMGSIALLRQTLYDAQWYKANNGRTEFNISLSAMNEYAALPKIFEVNDVNDILRAQKIADEFGLQFFYKSAGNEYQRLNELKKINTTYIIPLNYPKAYDVEDYFDAQNVSLADMKHWELAPYNLVYLEKEKIRFAITASDLKNPSDFWKNLRQTVKNGLSESQALNALTVIPAQLLKISDQTGTLRIGMQANFIVTSGDIFKEEARIYENWCLGERYAIQELYTADLRGDYDFSIPGIATMQLKISGTTENPEYQAVLSDSSKVRINATRNGNLLSLVFDPSLENAKGKIRLSGYIDESTPLTMKGEGIVADGRTVKWSAVYRTAYTPAEDRKETKAEDVPGDIIYPFAAYGSKELPKAEMLLIRNATVWTNEKEGKLENTDVLIDRGRIVSVGKNLTAGGARGIDGTNKHLTPGIIDEHSHIAITRGVNEGTQAVTSEVRIGDVLDANDVGIYRQLAGGVTTSQLLHGSANPVGGQAALIKLRWGRTAEELKFEGAEPFIKFALGENVKQSNWGERSTIRFPQTRMGVEQVYYDAFIRAKEYEKSMSAYESLSSSKRAAATAPRKDLELDALAEILNGKRFITCHSYVQSEINMLMKVADSMGFKINTFTHILEGYKVADKMKAHGAGGSTFSDWWAYKYEVIDAIPYNGALMSREGIITAFNSDDAEMARRLNQEAAKAVKYGNISEEEALKFVTLNPAKLLHIDQRVGSIRAGKDADLVLWNDHPLSVYARPEKTFVDGIAYFDSERDAELQLAITKERERLAQKMLTEKRIGNPVQKPEKKEKMHYHCDDVMDEAKN